MAFFARWEKLTLIVESCLQATLACFEMPTETIIHCFKIGLPGKHDRDAIIVQTLVLCSSIREIVAHSEIHGKADTNALTHKCGKNVKPETAKAFLSVCMYVCLCVL